MYVGKILSILEREAIKVIDQLNVKVSPWTDFGKNPYLPSASVPTQQIKGFKTRAVYLTHRALAPVARLFLRKTIQPNVKPTSGIGSQDSPFERPVVIVRLGSALRFELVGRWHEQSRDDRTKNTLITNRS